MPTIPEALETVEYPNPLSPAEETRPNYDKAVAKIKAMVRHAMDLRVCFRVCTGEMCGMILRPSPNGGWKYHGEESGLDKLMSTKQFLAHLDQLFEEEVKGETADEAPYDFDFLCFKTIPQL